MKRCLTSLVKRETQIKITGRYYYAPIKHLKLRRLPMQNVGEDMK